MRRDTRVWRTLRVSLATQQRKCPRTDWVNRDRATPRWQLSAENAAGGWDLPPLPGIWTQRKEVRLSGTVAGPRPAEVPE